MRLGTRHPGEGQFTDVFGLPSGKLTALAMAAMAHENIYVLH